MDAKNAIVMMKPWIFFIYATMAPIANHSVVSPSVTNSNIIKIKKKINHDIGLI